MKDQCGKACARGSPGNARWEGPRSDRMRTHTSHDGDEVTERPQRHTQPGRARRARGARRGSPHDDIVYARPRSPRLRSKVWHVCACTALLTRDATHTKPGGPRATPRGSHRTHEGGRLATACSTSNARLRCFCKLLTSSFVTESPEP